MDIVEVVPSQGIGPLVTYSCCLLLCDGHDSHISAGFVRYCIDNKIVLFLLPPHSSHLLQPLDVGVFRPVKAAMSLLLGKLYATEISRLQKIEWLEIYIKACSKSIVEGNTWGMAWGWFISAQSTLGSFLH